MADGFTKINRTNQYRLNPTLLPITYESNEIIASLDSKNGPRKYTSIHNDKTGQIYINIGHDYNKLLLEEVAVEQSQVIGKWIKEDGEYEIHLRVLVSTNQNSNAESRNKIFYRELGLVLEGIAFAETALLKSHPRLASTKIYIRFKSIDSKYDRTEYWHRLGHWTQKSMQEIPTPKPTSKPPKEIKKKRHYQRRSPQMCQACRK